MAIKLIVGLQNPGAAYEQTRHNVGGWLVETLACRHRAAFQLEKKLFAKLSSFTLDGHPCKALLPTTFMNLSGKAARAVCQFYKIQPEEILVVHDDLDLPCGRIKLKTDGGHGGHNGLKDLTAQLGTSTYHRLRIGIGHPGHKSMVLEYVLGKPSPEDKENILNAIDRGIEIMPLLLSQGIMNAMNILHKQGA